MFVYVGGEDAVAVLRITDGGAALSPHAQIPVSGTSSAMAVRDDLLFSINNREGTLCSMRMSQDRTAAVPVAEETIPSPTAILCM